MKKVLEKISRTVMGLLPNFAMKLAVQSAESTCFYCLHQPDVPEKLLKED